MILAALAIAAQGAPPPTPINLGFETADEAGVPDGWALAAASARESIRIDTAEGRSGRGARLHSPAGAPAPRGNAVAVQTIDAAPYRGKRVRLSAHARPAVSGRGGVALEMKRLGEAPATFSSSARFADFAAGAWGAAEILARVLRDADVWLMPQCAVDQASSSMSQ